MIPGFEQKAAKVARKFLNRTFLPSPCPSRAVVQLLCVLLFSLRAPAEVAPVAVRVPEPNAWVGQRVSVYFELRAPGSFAGTARFEVPQLPGTLWMKIGNPVVASEVIEGKTWFVQTHEFALFSQKAGPLEVPAFPVRFERHEGFTGPVVVVGTMTPATTIGIQRPPGSEGIGFLITTESLDLTETWDPAPGAAQVGAMFKRTITQRAPDMTGMALAPAPDTAPEGIRVYPGAAATKDQLGRGDFLGERRETLTYLMQKPGTLTLPGLTYIWWNPGTRTLQSKTLPAVTFEVTAPAAVARPADPAFPHFWPWLLAGGLLAGSFWQRQRCTAWFRRAWKALHPPDRVAARKLLHACRRNDAPLASAAWMAWRNTRPASFQPAAGLQRAVLAMQRQQFGPAPAADWQGDDLAHAFRRNLKANKSLVAGTASALPPLNP